MTQVFNRAPARVTRRELREKTTEAEAELWRFLRNRHVQYRFRRQHSIGRYIADFYCAKAKLVIEIDGGYHNDPEVKKYDELRQDYFQALGLTVLRFTNKEVVGNVGKVIVKIADFLGVEPWEN